MKTFITLSAIAFASVSFAQSVPSKTLVSMVASKDFNEKVLKSEGGMGLFVIEKDVVANGKTIIAAQTPINVLLEKATKSDLKIVIAEVKGTDGSTIVIDDCWLYTSIDQNLTGKPKGPVFRKGTRKICYTK
ncbi:MAG: hypothetical protein KF872_11595 [Chitinophagales bacterium]|nr:hypothetical protein [Chitinophagales bacterium]